MTLNVRKFQQDDYAATVDLWRRVFPDDPPHNEPAAMLSAKLAVDDLVFVAENESRIVGACMAGYDGHRGWLYAVAVLPETRGTGAGAALVEAAIDALRALGCVKVNLQVRSGNSAVTAFYEQLGFAVEDRVSMGKLIG